MTASRPAIVWFRDDLRVSDHPALHAASNTHAPAVVPLRARREGAGPPAAWRRGALVAGAVAARPASEPAEAWGVAGAAQGGRT